MQWLHLCFSFLDISKYLLVLSISGDCAQSRHTDEKRWELFSFHFLRACHLAGMTGFAAAARTGSFLFGCTRCGGSLATTAKKLKPEKKPNSVVGA